MTSIGILVVDDEADARSALRRLLETDGFEVAEASDGASALELVRRTCPAVVVTDLRMPGMSGLELCQALRVEHPLVSVIVLTGHGDVPSAVQGMQHGAVDFMVKPLVYEALSFSVRRALQTRAMEIEHEQLAQQSDALYREALAALRARQETASIVAHELRNSLNVMRLGADVLLNRALSPTETRSIAERFVSTTQRMERLIQDLREDVRLPAAGPELSLEPHAVKELLIDAADLRPMAWQKQITLKIEAPAEDRLLQCDRLRMAQVIANLIGNAIKFTPAGGRVVVSATYDVDEVCLEVRDNGVGIRPEEVPRVFDRFWRSPLQKEPGVGLGLYIAKQIVDAHKGRIAVESELGYWTAFKVHLPSS